VNCEQEEEGSSKEASEEERQTGKHSSSVGVRGCTPREGLAPFGAIFTSLG